MRTLHTILATTVAILVVLFAISNRTPVVVEVWPFPYQLQLGLYAVILLAVATGFAAGLIAAWLSGGKRRRELRALRKETRDLRASLARTQTAQETAAAATPAATDPALR